MRILVSGSAGFVGRHYVDFLLREGHEVFGFDIKDDAHPHQDHPRYHHEAELDARDHFSFPRERFAFGTDQFDVVIHLAAIVGGRATIDGEPLTVATDLGIDAAFFNWCFLTRPQHVIYFSSSAAYGVELQREPGYLLQETDLAVAGGGRILLPDMTYGWSKLTGEYLAHHLRQAGVDVHVFRPFSGYGSDQGAEYPFGAFIDRAQRHADPFEIWGTGDQCRDWVHIDDVVRGTWEITLTAPPDVYNICTGKPTSFTTLARLVTTAAGYSPEEFRFLKEKPSGVQYRVGDPTTMLRYFKPKITLANGIAMALDERGHG
jgi:nucleoside-diphosphate-sugar epimerase